MADTPVMKRKVAQRPRRRTGIARLLTLMLAAGACGGASQDKPKREKPKREAWTVPGVPSIRELARVGAFEDSRLSEASGVVPSTGEPGVFWSQNDRGNKPVLFAYDATGASRGTVTVRGTSNTDWEALAIGPCAEGSCLYIGDIGDNFAARADVQVLRLPEPSTGAESTEPLASLRVIFPGGARDIEAMWVSADTSLWFATKRPMSTAEGRLRPSLVYRVLASAWRPSGGTGSSSTAPAAATLVDSLPIVPGESSSRDWVSDAALSGLLSDGRRRLAVLTYGSVYVFDADPATGRPGAQLGRCALPPRERNAEGITWLPDGRLLLVNEGRGAALYRGHCP